MKKVPPYIWVGTSSASIYFLVRKIHLKEEKRYLTSSPRGTHRQCLYLSFAIFSLPHSAEDTWRSGVATNDIFHLFSTFLFSLSGQWERKIVLTKGFNPSRCSHIMSANFGGFQTPLVRFPNHYFWLMSQLGNLTRPPPPPCPLSSFGSPPFPFVILRQHDHLHHLQHPHNHNHHHFFWRLAAVSRNIGPFLTPSVSYPVWSLSLSWLSSSVWSLSLSWSLSLQQ